MYVKIIKVLSAAILIGALRVKRTSIRIGHMFTMQLCQYWPCTLLVEVDVSWPSCSQTESENLERILFSSLESNTAVHHE